MGGAMVEGLIKGDYIQNEDICISDPSRTSRDRFADMGITATPSNQLAAQGADVVCVVVKPWLVEQVLRGIKEVLDYRQQYLVVIAAGIKETQLREWLEKGDDMIPTFMAIPNIAISQLQSMTFLVPCASAEPQHTEPPLPRMATVYIGKGEKDKISKGDIVGFLCKAGGLTAGEIGRIDVKERYSYAAVRREKLRQVLQQTRGEKLKGIKTIVEEVR